MIHAPARKTKLFQPRLALDLQKGLRVRQFAHNVAMTVGIEACASSHHWSRELQALGHTVRLTPPANVKPYLKRQKNDTTAVIRSVSTQWVCML